MIIFENDIKHENKNDIFWRSSWNALLLALFNSPSSFTRSALRRCLRAPAPRLSRAMLLIARLKIYPESKARLLKASVVVWGPFSGFPTMPPSITIFTNDQMSAIMKDGNRGLYWRLLRLDHDGWLLRDGLSSMKPQRRRTQEPKKSMTPVFFQQYATWCVSRTCNSFPLPPRNLLPA